jgi:hypothetical protein
MQTQQISGSSPEPDIQAAQEPIENAGAPGETEESLLSVVQSVSEQSDVQQADDSQSESPTEEQQSEIAAEQPEDRKSKDYSDVPFNAHPRFKELIKEKNTYKAKVVEYESDAKQYRQIQEFMQNSQLTAEEVAEGLILLAEMKSGDASKAYDALQKKLETLAVTAGKKLPQDIEQRIEQGYVDRETAEQMYQQQAVAQRQAQLAQARLNQTAVENQRQQVMNIANTVAAWESATRVSDPDFDIKAELVRDRVRAKMASLGMPRTPDEALSLSKGAYEEVSQMLKRAQGPKQAMRTAVGGKVNGSAAPEPQNLLDVIRQASAGA